MQLCLAGPSPSTVNADGTHANSTQAQGLLRCQTVVRCERPVPGQGRLWPSELQ